MILHMGFCAWPPASILAAAGLRGDSRTGSDGNCRKTFPVESNPACDMLVREQAVFVFASKAAVICLMAYIVAVALYGSFTSNPKIILMQGGLAILTLISCIF